MLMCTSSASLSKSNNWLLNFFWAFTNSLIIIIVVTIGLDLFLVVLFAFLLFLLSFLSLDLVEFLLHLIGSVIIITLCNLITKVGIFILGGILIGRIRLFNNIISFIISLHFWFVLDHLVDNVVRVFIR